MKDKIFSEAEIYDAIERASSVENVDIDIRDGVKESNEALSRRLMPARRRKIRWGAITAVAASLCVIAIGFGFFRLITTPAQSETPMKQSALTEVQLKEDFDGILTVQNPNFTLQSAILYSDNQTDAPFYIKMEYVYTETDATLNLWAQFDVRFTVINAYTPFTLEKNGWTVSYNTQTAQEFYGLPAADEYAQTSLYIFTFTNAEVQYYIVTDLAEGEQMSVEEVVELLK